MRKQPFDQETWRGDLPAWCQLALGARPARTLFEAVAVASLIDSEAFLAAYETARSLVWTRPERQAAWAASLGVMAYDAKGESLDGVVGPVSKLLIAERAERLRRAGA